MIAVSAPLRAQHRPSAPENGKSGQAHCPPPSEAVSAARLGRTKKAPPGASVRVTVRLGLAPNSLAFWRRRRFGTAAAFAAALSEATGLHITPPYVRYWETAIGVPPAAVVEAVALILEIPPTLVWTREQLRAVQ